jgi:hypothetical protein
VKIVLFSWRNGRKRRLKVLRGCLAWLLAGCIEKFLKMERLTIINYATCSLRQPRAELASQAAQGEAVLVRVAPHHTHAISHPHPVLTSVSDRIDGRFSSS